MAVESQKPFFSVVCPVYNAAPYLKRTIESLLNQTHKNFEVIFIDDGSKDNSLTILDSFKKSFIENKISFTLIKQDNKGPGSARNAGILKAQGQWISFLDADDEWLPQKLEKMFDLIQQNPNLNFLNHWTKWFRLSGDTLLEKNGSQLKTTHHFFKELFCRNGIATSAVTVKKELFLNYGLFDTSFPMAQDFELWLRLSPFMNFDTLEEVLGYYHETKGNISSKPYYVRYWQHLRIYKKHWKLVGIKTSLFMFFRKTLTKAWLSCFKNLLQRQKT